MFVLIHPMSCKDRKQSSEYEMRRITWLNQPSVFVIIKQALAFSKIATQCTSQHAVGDAHR